MTIERVSVLHDRLLDATIVAFGAPGAAGTVNAQVGAVTLTLDIEQPGRLVRIVVPTDRVGDADQLLTGIMGPSAPGMLLHRIDHPAAAMAETSDHIIAILARLAVAASTRGEGTAWDVELARIVHDLCLACGVQSTSPDVRSWLRGEADLGALDPGFARDLEPGPADDDVIILAGHARLTGAAAATDRRLGRLADGDRVRGAWRRVEAAAPSGVPGLVTTDEIRSGTTSFKAPAAPAVLTLTERRALSAVGGWRWQGTYLIGDPAGPAGEFVVTVGPIIVQADIAEPTRILKASGVDSASHRDPDDAASDLARDLQPILVLERDLHLLQLTGTDGIPEGLARAELALRLADLGLDGAQARARTEGRRAWSVLGRDVGPSGSLSESARDLLDLLRQLVDPRTVRDTGPAFRGSLGPAAWPTGIGVDDVVARLEEELGGGEIGPGGAVALTEASRRVLAPDGGSPRIDVQIDNSTHGRLIIDAPAGVGRARIRLRNGMALVGEVVVALPAITTVDADLAGTPTDVDVEAVAEVSRDDAMSRCQGAVWGELQGDLHRAADRWLVGADLWADAGQPDRAAIAIERAATLLDPELGWRLLRRAVVLGTEWATGRPRPPLTFKPIWRQPS